jgi:hypothetical protein
MQGSYVPAPPRVRPQRFGSVRVARGTAIQVSYEILTRALLRPIGGR